MQIKSISIENIKSHTSTKIDFPAGITAILGSNGSGKSTILEAIGTVLFQSLGYTQQQFIRDGEKKGKIVLDIVTDNDEFQIVKAFGSSADYYIEHDGKRVVENKEEVVPFIKDALGIDPTTDMPRLFQDVVGVPQGLHTSHFMLPTASRKLIFEPIMNVEQYADIRKRLLKVVNLAKDKQQDIDNQLNNLQGQVTDYDQLRSDEIIRKEKLNGINKDIDQARITLTERTAAKETLEQWSANNIKLVQLRSQIEELTKTHKEYSENASKVAGYEQELEDLKPLKERQEELEKQINGMTEQVYGRRTVTSRIEDLGRGVSKSNKEADNLRSQLKTYDDVALLAKDYKEFENECAILIGETSSVDSRLIDLEKYRESASCGECPILKEDCPKDNLKGAFDRQITTNKEQSERLHKRESDAMLGFDKVKAAVKELETLDRHKETLRTVEGSIKTDQAKIEGFEQELKMLEELSKERTRLNDELTALEDPRKRSERLEITIWNSNGYERKATEAATRLEQLNIACEELTVKAGNGSQEALDKAVKAYQDCLVQCSALKQKHKDAADRLYEVQSLVSDREKKLVKVGALQKEAERKEAITGLISRVRDIAKEVPERLVEQYMYHINYDANILFNEITGTHTEIVWTNSYELLLGGKTFSQLSGGEQMVSALAVRLALLKNLTDINIVIFDEPTINLDEERRAGLAEMIGNITGFSQVFVISHDDTFDTVIDNVIHLDKVDGETKIV